MAELLQLDKLFRHGHPIDDSFVDYPKDGFVYLYPRNHRGQLHLLQMVVNEVDPDNLSIQNPTFRRDAEQK